MELAGIVEEPVERYSKRVKEELLSLLSTLGKALKQFDSIIDKTVLLSSDVGPELEKMSARLEKVVDELGGIKKKL